MVRRWSVIISRIFKENSSFLLFLWRCYAPHILHMEIFIKTASMDYPFYILYFVTVFFSLNLYRKFTPVKSERNFVFAPAPTLVWLLCPNQPGSFFILVEFVKSQWMPCGKT